MTLKLKLQYINSIVAVLAVINILELIIINGVIIPFESLRYELGGLGVEDVKL